MSRKGTAKIVELPIAGLTAEKRRSLRVRIGIVEVHGLPKTSQKRGGDTDLPTFSCVVCLRGRQKEMSVKDGRAHPLFNSAASCSFGSRGTAIECLAAAGREELANHNTLYALKSLDKNASLSVQFGQVANFNVPASSKEQAQGILKTTDIDFSLLIKAAATGVSSSSIKQVNEMLGGGHATAVNRYISMAKTEGILSGEVARLRVGLEHVPLFSQGKAKNDEDLRIPALALLCPLEASGLDLSTKYQGTVLLTVSAVFVDGPTPLSSPKVRQQSQQPQQLPILPELSGSPPSQKKIARSALRRSSPALEGTEKHRSPTSRDKGQTGDAAAARKSSTPLLRESEEGAKSKRKKEDQDSYKKRVEERQRKRSVDESAIEGRRERRLSSSDILKEVPLWARQYERDLRALPSGVSPRGAHRRLPGSEVPQIQQKLSESFRPKTASLRMGTAAAGSPRQRLVVHKGIHKGRTSARPHTTSGDEEKALDTPPPDCLFAKTVPCIHVSELDPTEKKARKETELDALEKDLPEKLASGKIILPSKLYIRKVNVVDVKGVMNPVLFQKTIKELKDLRRDGLAASTRRVGIIREAIRNCRFMVHQVIGLVHMMHSHIEKKEVAYNLYRFTIDQENYAAVIQMLQIQRDRREVLYRLFQDGFLTASEADALTLPAKVQKRREERMESVDGIRVYKDPGPQDLGEALKRKPDVWGQGVDPPTIEVGDQIPKDAACLRRRSSSPEPVEVEEPEVAFARVAGTAVQPPRPWATSARRSVRSLADENPRTEPGSPRFSPRVSARSVMSRGAGKAEADLLLQQFRERSSFEPKVTEEKRERMPQRDARNELATLGEVEDADSQHRDISRQSSATNHSRESTAKEKRPHSSSKKLRRNGNAPHKTAPEAEVCPQLLPWDRDEDTLDSSRSNGGSFLLQTKGFANGTEPPSFESVIKEVLRETVATVIDAFQVSESLRDKEERIWKAKISQSATTNKTVGHGPLFDLIQQEDSFGDYVSQNSSFAEPLSARSRQQQPSIRSQIEGRSSITRDDLVGDHSASIYSLPRETKEESKEKAFRSRQCSCDEEEEAQNASKPTSCRQEKKATNKPGLLQLETSSSADASSTVPLPSMQSRRPFGMGTGRSAQPSIGRDERPAKKPKLRPSVAHSVLQEKRALRLATGGRPLGHYFHSVKSNIRTDTVGDIRGGVFDRSEGKPFFGPFFGGDGGTAKLSRHRLGPINRHRGEASNNWSSLRASDPEENVRKLLNKQEKEWTELVRAMSDEFFELASRLRHQLIREKQHKLRITDETDEVAPSISMRPTLRGRLFVLKDPTPSALRQTEMHSTVTLLEADFASRMQELKLTFSKKWMRKETILTGRHEEERKRMKRSLSQFHDSVAFESLTLSRKLVAPFFLGDGPPRTAAPHEVQDLRDARKSLAVSSKSFFPSKQTQRKKIQKEPWTEDGEEEGEGRQGDRRRQKGGGFSIRRGASPIEEEKREAAKGLWKASWHLGPLKWRNLGTV